MLGKSPIAIVAGVAAAFAVMLYALQYGLSYKELIVVFGTLTGVVIVLGRERGIRFGFVLWIATLALGYRTIGITTDFRIHPGQVVLLLLFVCILPQRKLTERARFSLPLWLWLLMPFFVFGWWPLVVGDARWDAMLNEFINFLLIVPLIVVAAVVLEHENYWRVLLLVFFVASTWIAALGLLEYLFPEVVKLFPAFMNSTRIDSTPEGFVRAKFAFWGGPEATFICVIALPIAIALAGWWKTRWHQAMIILASIAQVVAIYIAGYRSIWMLLCVEVLVGLLLGVKRRNFAIAILSLVVIAGGYQFIPKLAAERAISGMRAIQGNPVDSSALVRQQRALATVSATVDEPLGSGWASSGWVHSDFIQVAANLGIIAGIIFLGGYLYTLVRLGRRALAMSRRNDDGKMGLALFLSFIGVGGLLAMEGVEVLPQMILPVWFVWALVEIWLWQTFERASQYVHRDLEFAVGSRNA